jgi:hypothetical protein
MLDCDWSSDVCSSDLDGDGIPTCVEANTAVGIDPDGDHIPNWLDPNSDDDALFDFAEGTDDDDGDTIPNYLDADSGSTDPTDPNQPIGDPVAGRDADDDGILDQDECPGLDHCVDTDGDMLADYADNDDDGDGIRTTAERPGHADRDSDADGTPDHRDPDDDGDSVLTRRERPSAMDRDSDRDGMPDHLDNDDDNDGVATIQEYPSGLAIDRDHDGIPDYLDDDDDGDGIATLDELMDETELGGDLDGDRQPAYVDTDSDGDGLPDAFEGRADRNQDGHYDYLTAGGLAGGACSVARAPSFGLFAPLMMALMLLWLRRRSAS